jgi:hypothetical protein
VPGASKRIIPLIVGKEEDHIRPRDLGSAHLTLDVDGQGYDHQCQENEVMSLHGGCFHPIENRGKGEHLFTPLISHIVYFYGNQ